MTAKEYLNQAYRLDQRITSKLAQVESLRSLAQRVTLAYDSEKVSHARNVTAMEDTIHRLMAAEQELNDTIDALVELKREVYATIQKVKSPEFQLLLEQRYLCYKSWSEIAACLNLEERYVYKVHGRALQAVEKNMEMVQKDMKRQYKTPAPV